MSNLKEEALEKMIKNRKETEKITKGSSVALSEENFKDIYENLWNQGRFRVVKSVPEPGLNNCCHEAPIESATYIKKLVKSAESRLLLAHEPYEESLTANGRMLIKRILSDPTEMFVEIFTSRAILYETVNNSVDRRNFLLEVVTRLVRMEAEIKFGLCEELPKFKSSRCAIRRMLAPHLAKFAVEDISQRDSIRLAEIFPELKETPMAKFGEKFQDLIGAVIETASSHRQFLQDLRFYWCKFINKIAE